MPEQELGVPSADLELPPGEAGPAETGPASTGPAEAGTEPDGAVAAVAEIAASVDRLAAAAEQYHVRAKQREDVIEHLRDELDLLRRGERRSLLRPLLVAVTRLHADLLLQARDLPADFDAERARLLLTSFAETVEVVLGDAGVTSYAPEAGDAFDPRRHRKIKGEPTNDPAQHGLVAAVRKPGYLDIETQGLLSPAEVTLYTANGVGQ